jgi:hypothetical protein
MAKSMSTGEGNNDFIRKEPPSLEFPTLEFPNNTKSPSLEMQKLLDSLLTQPLGLNQRCFANFRSGGTVLKIKWAWSLDWAWPHA